MEQDEVTHGNVCDRRVIHHNHDTGIQVILRVNNGYVHNDVRYVLLTIKNDSCIALKMQERKRLICQD